MGFRALLLSSILATGACLPLSVLAQGDQPTQKPDAMQTRPAQTQPSPVPATHDDQPQLPPDADQGKSQAQPAVEPNKTDGPEVKHDGVKHDGGKKDVGAIGERKVGGFDMYTIEDDIKIGKFYATQFEQSVKLVQDPRINEYVNRVGQNLVRNSDAKVPFTIKVVDSDVINAMALPGGFFYVNSGLILAADNEAELAGVMAHEIAHVAARHTTRQLTRYQFINYASLPLIFMGGWTGYALYQAAGLAIPLGFLTFSRAFESEADMLGLEYMYKTGYDPTAFVDFFEKIETLEKKKPGT